jgi:tetratricopeptide (TPR) repeat protein
MKELGRFRAAEDWDGLLKSYQKLPSGLQADKAMALLRCGAARHLGPQELLEALTFVQRNFPRDSSFEFVTLDVLLLQKKYDVALNVVDKIDERVGGDPYLEVIRAGLYNRSGKNDLARERAQQALRREPELARLLPPPLVALIKESGPVAPSARPATTQVAVASSPAAPRVISNKLRLQGVFLRAGRPSAIISGQTVYEGDAFEGMQITKIEKSRVTVQLATGELRSLTFD